MQSRLETYNVNLIIVDHYDTIINHLDIHIEKLIARCIRHSSKKGGLNVDPQIQRINDERRELIQRITQIKEQTLAANANTQESFDLKWAELISDTSVAYAYKLDLFKSDLIRTDCVLMKDLKSRSNISMWIMPCFMSDRDLAFWSHFDADKGPIKEKCLHKDEDHPFGLFIVKVNNLERHLIKNYCLLSEMVGKEMSGLVKDYRDLDIHAINSLDFNRDYRIIWIWFQLEAVDNHAFVELRHLEELSMSNMRLEVIKSKAFSDLANLKHINLSLNCLTRIDSALFSQLACLETLNLSSNELTSIEANTFKGLGKLKKLDLTSNQLCTIDANLFADLGDLVELSLCDNKIHVINNGQFSFLSKLEQVSLSYNKFVTLERDTFAGLTHLRICNMIGNKFEGDLDAKVFADLPALRILELPKKLCNMAEIKADLAKSNINLVLNFQ